MLPASGIASSELPPTASGIAGGIAGRIADRLAFYTNIYYILMISYIKKLLNDLFEFSNKGWHRSIFLNGIYVSYILFLIAFTGIFTLSPNYLSTLRLIINYYIIFILLIRFNPFISKTNITGNNEFDRRLVFSAACFMLISSSLFNYVDNYIHIRT